MDFQDVSHWQNNALNRKDSSRMGWSDISVSLHGPIVEDLRAHFVERWNFIYNEKYDVRKDVRYSRLTFAQNAVGAVGNQGFYAPPPASRPPGQAQGQFQYFPPPPVSDRGLSEESEGQSTRGTDREHFHGKRLEEEVCLFRAILYMFSRTRGVTTYLKRGPITSFLPLKHVL